MHGATMKIIERLDCLKDADDPTPSEHFAGNMSENFSSSTQ
jgi:hypothetical protein